MENNRIYIVSFSDSRKYILREKPGKESKLVEIENNLNEYLSREFPGETFAYYTSPKVVEINEEVAAAEYTGYPLLDDRAVEEIKKELDTEIKNMEAQKELSADAPFSDVDATVADVPESVSSIL